MTAPEAIAAIGLAIIAAIVMIPGFAQADWPVLAEMFFGAFRVLP